MRFAAIALTILSFLTATHAVAKPPVFASSYEEAIEADSPNTLVVFGTIWCHYCKDLEDDMGSMKLDDWVVCVVDAGRREDLKKEYKLRSYPTSVVIRRGKEVARKVGYDKRSYEAWLHKNGSK